MNKTYKFGVKNWKSDTALPFWVYKEFPSAYDADRWAMRISFSAKNSPYMVWIVPNEYESASFAEKVSYAKRCVLGEFERHQKDNTLWDADIEDVVINDIANILSVSKEEYNKLWKELHEWVMSDEWVLGRCVFS